MNAVRLDRVIGVQFPSCGLARMDAADWAHDQSANPGMSG